MTVVETAFYEYDFALAMAKVAVAMTEGYDQEVAQQAAVDAAQATLDHLAQAETAPEDLTEQTTARVLELKAHYEQQFANTQELLALPEGTQQALGVDVVAMQMVATTATQWIAAFIKAGY